MLNKPFRGMVVEVALDSTAEPGQGRCRLCVVVQNDVGNRFSTTTIVVPLADAANVKQPSPIYVFVKKGDGGAVKDCYVLCDQIRTVDQRRFRNVHGTVSPETMTKVDRVLQISLGLVPI